MAEFSTSYPEKSRKKWIITGGAGLIGCHTAAGQRVIIVDNLRRKGAAENVAWLRGQGITNFVRADVRDAQAMHDLLAQHAEADMPSHMNHGG